MYMAGHLGGEAFAQFLVGQDSYPAQQALHILAHNALWLVLRGGNIAVRKRDRYHVGQAVIGLFFGTHPLLVPLFTSADDVIRDIKNIYADALNLLWLHMPGCVQI